MESPFNELHSRPRSTSEPLASQRLKPKAARSWLFPGSMALRRMSGLLDRSRRDRDTPA